MNITKSNLIKIIISLTLGLNSGLVYALISSSFTAYLYDNKIDKTTIGLLSARLIPYSFKYILAPFIDNLNIKFFPKNFGQRKMWIILSQILLIISISILSTFNINEHFYYVSILSFIVAFIATMYDISMEAYRIEMFNSDDLSKGTLANMLGWRIGLLITGAGGLYLSHFISWNIIFISTSIIIMPCMLVAYNATDNRVVDNNISNSKNWLEHYITEPLRALSKIPNFSLIIIVIGFYRVSDKYLDTMLIPFLMESSYSKLQIATTVQTIGITVNIIATIFAAMIMKANVIKNLFFIELLAALSNLLYIFLVDKQASNYYFIFVIIVDTLASGLSNIILIFYMSSLCDRKFTATHYAIFSSIPAIFRTLLSMTAGKIAASYGWAKFFIISSSFSIPSLICLILLYKKTQKSYKSI